MKSTANRSITRPLRTLGLTGGGLALALAGALLPSATAAPGNGPDAGQGAGSGTGSWAESAYRGAVDVVSGPDEDQQTIDGVVFVDRDEDSEQDRHERGLPGVTVTNGRDVTTTDRRGRYELPAFDNMTVSVTQPRGYQVPVDDDNVAQFYYHHLPEGSPELRYGGLEPDRRRSRTR